MPRRWTNAGAQGGGPIVWLEKDLHKAWERSQIDYRVLDLERRYGWKRNEETTT